MEKDHQRPKNFFLCREKEHYVTAAIIRTERFKRTFINKCLFGFYYLITTVPLSFPFFCKPCTFVAANVFVLLIKTSLAGYCLAFLARILAFNPQTSLAVSGRLVPQYYRLFFRVLDALFVSIKVFINIFL